MAKKEIDKLSVGRLPPKLDKLVSNLIRLDRKHQKSEMLKRLPSELEITTILVSHSGVGMSKAIHKLAEEKLK